MFSMAAIVLAVLSGGAPLAAAQEQAAPIFTIHIVEYPPYFENQFPDTVPVGAIVRWVNKGSQTHTASAQGCVFGDGPCYFDSGFIYPGQYYDSPTPVMEQSRGKSYKFNCGIHPIMSGVLKIAP